MKYDYKFGNTCYNYYGDYGIKSTKYKILASPDLLCSPTIEYNPTGPLS